MTHTNLVASEMNNQGFKVRAIGQMIEVSLNSRKVSQMEVRTALSQVFEDIEFTLQSTSDGVLITV